MLHTKSESDITSLAPSSPSRSPKRSVYFVQSPSRESQDGDYKSSYSIQATPNFRSPMESPSHPSHSRNSSSTRFSGMFRSHSGRKLHRKRNEKGWPECNVIVEEGNYEEYYDDEKRVTTRLQALMVLIGFILLFTILCLIIWGAARPYKAEITVKSLAVNSLYIGQGSDSSGVITKLLTINGSLRLGVRNPATFFGIHVSSTPVNLVYSEIVIATGQLKKYYQPRKSRREAIVNIEATKVPLYGAGSSLAVSDTGVFEIPLRLELEIRSKGEVVGGKMSMAEKAEMGEEMEQKFGAFPFKPYSIQIDFMNALYDSLDKGGIAMLESPTGTGKTLSIICSALQWLFDQKQRRNNDSSVDTNQNRTNGDHVASDDEPDWLRNVLGTKEVESPKKKVKVKKRYGFSSKKRGETEIEESFRDLYNQLREIEVDLEHNNLTVKGDGEKLDDKEFLVEEYESGDEKNGVCKRKAGGICSGSSSGDDEDKEFSDIEEEADFKIYFCSRTHSQLSQFVKELRKTVFANELKVTCLGSRKNFCINEEVSKLGSSTLINERCMDLLKNKKSQVSKMKNSGAGGRKRQPKASSGCPMLSKHKLQKQLRNEMTEKGPLDIEDLVRLGGNLGTCPYYGSRSMVPAADLVVLPYQSILSKSSRESLGLSLKNSVVIIDEAHNLADSLISMYDSKVTFYQLELVNSSLEGYFQRFHNLLGPRNRRHIQTLTVLTRAFIQTLSNKDDPNFVNSSGSECSLCINEFVFSLNIDNINLVKLLQYIKDSNMIHKVSGYGDKIISLQNDTTSIVSAFRALAGILLSLTNHGSDGRIIISRKKPTEDGQQGGYLKYVMLTGEKIFHEIVNEAHAVVLAGGTLQPIEETRMRLFPWLLPDQLHFFSCGHIISSDNILPISVSTGPSGQPFDFSYSSRSTPAMVGELGLLLCNLATIVPQGIIVFFSSFDYEEHVYNAWKASGILGRIMKKKHVFREPRKNTEVEIILKEYKESIDTASVTAHNGAVILAVVGGKISEGINFSDGLGRCIVMVGLPYPSPSDIELMERVKHIDRIGDPIKNSSGTCFSGDTQAGFEILRSCKHRGREYYENLCMKAVNQSIGRAIRHINDYAAILLVDTRYTSDSSRKNFSHPTNKLPDWIKNRLVSKTSGYGEVHRLLNQFFKFHKSKSV
ncbi:hypothetical protein SSX86_013566 [Deinandra increscens subsp. villosa]|uniref:Helicase ATP-binding domain-containing protein n=1 Tax=Deinandra increscens subsp. villosa TaxID=3103831 RepID=A0AAP0D4X6_9ASTR